MSELVDDMATALIEFLQAYMDEHNLDQNEFGRKADISSGTMSNIMTGKSKRPSDEILKKLSKATGKSYLSILSKVDPQVQQDLDENFAYYDSTGKQFTLSTEERMLLKEFSKLSEAKRKALITLVLQPHA